MISPDGLLDHAERLANTRSGFAEDTALRRGVSAAYYAVFHDLTWQAASHLIGSCGQEAQNEIRRTWSDGEISELATDIVEWSKIAINNPPKRPERLAKLGPLLDIAANDKALVEGLRLFDQMQEHRHAADYDHGAGFARSDLVTACKQARRARSRLGRATSVAREPFFTLLTVRRPDFRPR